MENEIKTKHLREEKLKCNKLDCMICLRKHPINKIHVIMDTGKFKVVRPELSSILRQAITDRTVVLRLLWPIS